MSKNLAAEQYQMLTSIWPKWQALACSLAPDNQRIEETDKRKAQTAVKALYAFYGHDEPSIAWLDSPRILSDEGTTPFVSHCYETLIFSGWHKLADPAWICSQIGYDRRRHIFHLSRNKREVFDRMRMPPRRRRPDWLAECTNVISQFDVDALAVVDLAQRVGRFDRGIKKLASIVERLVSSCFAVIMYEGACTLIKKPSTVMLNETLLSAQGQPAIEWSEANDQHHRLWVIQGQVLTVNEVPDTMLWQLVNASPQRRVLFIEYMGWEAFFKQCEKPALGSRLAMDVVHRDTYGTLYRIRFVNQEFLVVRVKNSTPEPDGSYQRFVLPVNAECRPLPHHNKPHERLGDPQPLTALNAVASTFGMTGPEYAAMLGAES